MDQDKIGMIKPAIWWAMALMSGVSSQDKFSWIPKMSWDELSSQYLESQRMAPGLDLFKMNMANKTQTDDIDNQIQQLETKKWQLYATAIKDARARGFDVDPRKLKTFLDQEEKAINNEIWYRQTERKWRLRDSEKEAEYQYQNLSNQFIQARTKQMNINDELNREITKPQSDPVKVTELMEQKKKADQEYNTTKKQFNKAGIEQPEVLLRKYADQPAEKTVNQVFEDLSFNVYQDGKWIMDTGKFIEDLRLTPEFKWLQPEETVNRLIEMTLDDPEALQEAMYLNLSLGGESKIDMAVNQGYDIQDAIDMEMGSLINNDPNITLVKIQTLIDSMMQKGAEKKQLINAMKMLGIDKETRKSLDFK